MISCVCFCYFFKVSSSSSNNCVVVHRTKYLKCVTPAERELTASFSQKVSKMYLSTIITAILLTVVDSHGIVGDAPIYDNSDSYYRRKLDTASKNTSVDLFDPNPYCDRYVKRFVFSIHKRTFQSSHKSQ